ncbi:MAG: hypothetical protein ACREOI_21060 [bacterium]
MLEQLTRALLYEGYALFPYKRTATKNVKPVPFGVVYPRDYNAHHAEAQSYLQTECLVKRNDDLEIEVKARFLQLRIKNLLERKESASAPEASRLHEDHFRAVESLQAGGEMYVSGWEAVEREVASGRLPISKLFTEGIVCRIDFPKAHDSQFLYNAQSQITGKQTNLLSGVTGAVMIFARPVEGLKDFFRVTVKIINTTGIRNPDTVGRDDIFKQSFLSTHTILQARGGEFISVFEPDEQWKAAVAQCQNINTWPVLVDRDNSTMLSSPIILYDHPQMAPQSTGDLFDSTEIEEALLLHVAALSDEEKRRLPMPMKNFAPCSKKPARSRRKRS